MPVDSVLSRLNPVVRAVLRTPLLHWALSLALMELTYTGRRTGRRISLPVGYRLRGNDVAVLVSEARSKTWWRNFRESGVVELRLRGRRRCGSARLVAAHDAYFRDSVEEVLRRVPWMKRVFQVDFEPETGLTAAQLAALGGEIACVRITLEPDS